MPTGSIATDRAQHFKGKGLITGGAGYLGRAIIERAQRENWPCELTVFSRDEEKQWLLPSGVRRVIGDVRDSHNLHIAMRGMDFVIHAAAMKFIPEAEYNVHEAVKTNVDGSRNVARAAVRAAVEIVIGVSTDKASLPVNTYGFTKALMERMFTEANNWSGQTSFSLVRYGNVIGSTGSIIPVFQRQLEEFGHVCVTDPKMTRFWMTADDAVDLILLAYGYSLGQRGCVYVPRCGAMPIGQLADIVGAGKPYDIIGVRPGEKLHEDLIHYQETARTEELRDYYIIHPAIEAGSYKALTYSSHSPAFWITDKDMKQMIASA